MDLDWLVVGGIAIALTGVAWWFDPVVRLRRKLARAPRKQLAETQDGDRVVVSGVVLAAGQDLRSPLTERPCVAYRVIVDEPRDDGPTTINLAGSVKFAIVAEGVEAVVDGPMLLGDEAAPITTSECPGLEDLLRERGIQRDKALYQEIFHCKEALVRAGDVVTVLGVVSVEIDPSGQRESVRGQPIRRTIRGRARDPMIVALAPTASGA